MKQCFETSLIFIMFHVKRLCKNIFSLKNIWLSYHVSRETYMENRIVAMSKRLQALIENTLRLAKKSQGSYAEQNELFR